jgi:hypothetical protein
MGGLDMKNEQTMVFFYKKLFFEEIQKDGLDPKNYSIAGGAIRDYLSGGEIKDIDLFSSNKESEDKLIEWFKKQQNIKILNENDLLLNVTYKGRWFQVIKGKFFNMEGTDLIDSFDYTVCCAMLNFEEFRYHDNFFQDVLSKHLRVNKITFPLSSLERMQKYIKKGYTACNGTLLSLSKEIQKVNLDNNTENTLEYYPDGGVRFLGVD